MDSKETHNDILELIPAYALGILEEDDTTLVATHLSTCSSCQAELSRFETVVDSLPMAAEERDSSAKLRQRLMSQIQTQTAVTDPPPQTLQNRKSWWQTILPRLQNAFHQPYARPAFILATIILIVGAFFIWQQTTSTQIKLTATTAAPDATGLIKIAPTDGDAALSVAGLPPLTPDQQYQLWLIKDGQRISGAVFSVADDGSAMIPIRSERPLNEFDAFGITIEPAGGSPGPTGERVLGYNL